jgi:serine/threonine protein kinase
LAEVRFLTYLKTNKPANFHQFYGCYRSDTDQKKPVYYLVMELLGEPFIPTEDFHPSTHLHQLLRKPPSDHLKVFSQLALQIKTIHNLGKTVNDIKPENFVFKDQISDEPRLIDFGGVAPVGEQMPIYSPLPTSYEAWKDQRGSWANDAWAFGFCLAVIEFGYLQVIKDYQRNDNILGISFDLTYWKKLNTFRNTMALLEKGPSWMIKPEGGSFKDLLHNLLEFDPKKRLTDFDQISLHLQNLAAYHAKIQTPGVIGPDWYRHSALPKLRKEDQEVLDTERMGPDRPTCSLQAFKIPGDEDSTGDEIEPIENGSVTNSRQHAIV